MLKASENHIYFADLTLHSAVCSSRVTLDNPQGETARSNTRCSSKTLALYAVHFARKVTRSTL